MQLTLSKPLPKWLNYKLLLVTSVILAGIFTYLHLSKKICAYCPIEIPLDYTTIDGIRTTADSEGLILLFRGVHAQHPDLSNAKMGIATPIGGHENPTRHNRGDNHSVFTSWTNDIFWANKFAYRRGIGGIILMKRFKTSELIYSQDRFYQGEILIKGIVTGAAPVPAFEP